MDWTAVQSTRVKDTQVEKAPVSGYRVDLNVVGVVWSITAVVSTTV